MSTEKDDFASIAHCQHKICDHFAAEWVQTGHWFIKDKDSGIVDERSCNANPLHHTFGVGANLTVGSMSKLEHCQEFLATLLDESSAHPMYRPVKLEELPAC
jgi:hypothetical protein